MRLLSVCLQVPPFFQHLQQELMAKKVPVFLKKPPDSRCPSTVRCLLRHAGVQAAQDLITAMLDAEDGAEAGKTAVEPVVEASQSEAAVEERRRKLLQQAQELKKKQEELGGSPVEDATYQL